MGPFFLYATPKSGKSYGVPVLYDDITIHRRIGIVTGRDGRILTTNRIVVPIRIITDEFSIQKVNDCVVYGGLNSLLRIALNVDVGSISVSAQKMLHQFSYLKAEIMNTSYCRGNLYKESGGSDLTFKFKIDGRVVYFE